MSKIISIGTALPEFKHEQHAIKDFMLNVFNVPDEEKRKISYLYKHGGISSRYSVLEDYSGPAEDRDFYPPTDDLEPFPNLEKRLEKYYSCAPGLSIEAIKDCIRGHIQATEITHLITVSCTGMWAPGLDISIMQALQLSPNTDRSSVNFMGCYAALHAMKIAHAICTAEPDSKVVIVCTELCTLHFQKEYNIDNITSSLLFGDGAAAALITGDHYEERGIFLKNFYSEVKLDGISDMSWHITDKGFLMTLSSYIPQLIKDGIEDLLNNALQHLDLTKEQITHWAIHPGGKKILEAIQHTLQLEPDALRFSADILNRYGNMSSPTILFVLKEMMESLQDNEKTTIFATAFGPGLTMETLILQS